MNPFEQFPKEESDLMRDSGDRSKGHGGAERGVILEAVVRRIALKEREISEALGEIPLWDGFQCYYEGLELKARKEMCGELIEDLKSYIPSLFTPMEAGESGAQVTTGGRSERSGGRNAKAHPPQP